MSELKQTNLDRKSAYITIKYKYRKGRKTLYENRMYEYDPDESWEKWNKMLLVYTHPMDRIKWFRKNVIISDVKGFDETIQLVHALEQKFGLTDKKMKEYLKVCGKVGRGINVPGFSKKAIEYTILKGMNGGIRYQDLPNISFKDLIFWKRMLDSEVQHSEDLMKENLRLLSNKIKK